MVTPNQDSTPTLSCLATVETVMLVDTDIRDNQVLDSVAFEKQEKDVALGRWPNGSGTLKQLQTTPGKENVQK